MKCALWLLFLGQAWSVWGQTNIVLPNSDQSGATADKPVVSTNVDLDVSRSQSAEQVRNNCILGRRSICGKILQVLPGGLVVESGYTDLLRPELNKTWWVPGLVSAHRPADLIESAAVGSPCVGVVFLTDIPKIRGSGPRPKQYDYVVLLGYPAGKYTYSSVGDIRKTVRQFSANLLQAVDINIAAEKKSDPSTTEVK